MRCCVKETESDRERVSYGETITNNSDRECKREIEQEVELYMEDCRDLREAHRKRVWERHQQRERES